MNQFRRLVFMFLVVCLILSIGTGCKTGTTSQTGTPKPLTNSTPLKLTAVCRWNPNPSYQPKDMALTNYILQKMYEYVGRKVEVEWINRPEDATMSLEQYFTTLTAANNVPDILWFDNLLVEPTAYQYLKKNNLVYEMTPELMKTNLPGFVGRLAKYGFADFDKYYKAQLDDDGKLLGVPQGVPDGAFTNYPDNYRPSAFAGWFNGWGFRDDVLKAVVPAAKTDKELTDLFIKNKGKLTVEQMVGDIPVTNYDTMLDYMRKVKALNWKVGDKPLIPGAINAYSEDVNSVFYSTISATGYGWRWAATWGDKPDLSDTFAMLPSDVFKKQVNWYRTMYNEGLLDPEIFVMKNDVYKQKMINGEYAIMHYWQPVTEAIKVGKDRGYSYRYVPAFYPVDMEKNSNKYAAVQLKASTIVCISKSVEEQDLKDVMKYVDFFMTEESDQLSFWGPPEAYKGEGLKRRYKDEYEDLENWVLYGTQSEKDGTYYGLGGGKSVFMGEGANMQHTTKPWSFFGAGQTYPEGPYFVLPKDPVTVAEKTGMYAFCSSEVPYQAIVPKQVHYMELGYNDFNQMMNPEWVKYEDAMKEKGQELKDPLIRCIVQSSTDSDFEKNWAEYVQVHKDCGMENAVNTVKGILMDKFQSDVIGNIVK